MYGLGFDPEVPAGYQDADIEMAELAEWANEQEIEKNLVERLTRKQGDKPKQLKCPNHECGNTDPTLMTLYVDSIDTGRWSSDGELEDGLWVFTYDKSVFFETAMDRLPTMVCDRCAREWPVGWEEIELE